ncbi:MAG: hypothetical protein WBF47_15070 [Xanthobacteraceae bacterium]
MDTTNLRYCREPPMWCSKEKRRLVLAVREAPLHGGYLNADDAA